MYVCLYVCVCVYKIIIIMKFIRTTGAKNVLINTKKKI